jgi:cytochrome c oxidase subunit 2
MNELLRRILFLPPQASTIAADVDGLHYFVILVTMAGATLVTLVGGYFLIRYRRSAVLADPDRRVGAMASPPLGLELGVVLGLFSLFLAWWVIGFWQFMRIRVAPENTLDIYVTGKQWMWKFAYPEGTHTIATLYVPAGRPVKLVLSSRDVIHSFYVPDFRVKQDAVPGRFTTMWFQADKPGRHEILCTEYCGISHSTMRGEVVVLTPEDYEKWLGASSPEPQLLGQEDIPPAVVTQYDVPEPVRLYTQGERVAAEKGCLRCHTLDGTPHLGPTWAGLYGSSVPLADGTTVKVDAAYITESMMEPLAKLHAGYSPIMPSYRGQIQPGETGAIVELIKHLRDVQPKPGADAPLWPVAPSGVPVGEEKP